MKMNHLITVGIISFGIVSAAQAQTLNDTGSTAPPTPGPNDQSQLLVAGAPTNPDGLNYYYNNNPPPGQTFTTGNNPNGYRLDSLYITTVVGSGQQPASGQTYTLRLYSVSGTNATLLATYLSQSNFYFFEGDWLEWTNLGLALQPNTQYAYSFYGSQDWENLSSVTNNPYAGGQVALIPTGGGAMTLGSSHNWDASFDIGLSVATNLEVSPVAVSSDGIFQGSGTPVTLSASAAGPGPISYQWRTDGGSGGTLSDIPDATNTTLTVETTNLAAGVYHYVLIASNSSSVITNSAQFTIVSPGTPILLTGVNPGSGWLTNGTVLEAVNVGPVGTAPSGSAGIIAEPVTINGINFGTNTTLTTWTAGTWSWGAPAFAINTADPNQTNMYSQGIDMATWAAGTAQITVPGTNLVVGHTYQLQIMFSGAWSYALANINSTPDNQFGGRQNNFFGSSGNDTNLSTYVYIWTDTSGGTAEVDMTAVPGGQGTGEDKMWGYALSDITSTTNQPVAISDPSLLTNGQFRLTMHSPSDTPLNVQTSTNLVNWSNSASVINFSGADGYTNANTVPPSMQFYRLQRPQ